MNPKVGGDARTEALAQAERAREDRAQHAAGSDHQASLYRGQTAFANAHRAHAKLLSNKLRANKLRARLAQARKPRMTKRGKFSASRKTAPQVLKHAHASMQRSPLHRAGGSRVTRDGGRGGGQQGQNQGQGQGQRQGQGQQQRDQDRRERSWRLSSLHAAPVASSASANLLDHTATHLADACCDALLSLRRQLQTNPHARIDSLLLRLAREATAARFAQGSLDAGSIEAIKERLIERSKKHGAPSARMADFNLLAGLHLLMMQRPLRRSNQARTNATLHALDASHV
ncbi:hypothetical protein [Caballeronia sp. LZ035]|uniref:hypothetical protein n=1 Tax=Caballeronia sp. LZ035 TaxID=3038568 RepID=UPI002862F737|nr:hypothetical protein [Caballeronia sp. LZ035]MDR5759443.1 hypothetical protein [Caballeronia sp. LZ035]